MSRPNWWPTPRVKVLHGRAVPKNTHGWDLPAALKDAIREEPLGRWLLSFSRLDTRVNRSRIAVYEGVRMIPDTSGLISSGLFTTYDPLDRIGSFSRMFPDTLLLGSTVCYLTWIVKDTPLGSSFFRLRASVRSIDGSEFGLSPRYRDNATEIDICREEPCAPTPEFVEALMGFPPDWTRL